MYSITNHIYIMSGATHRCMQCAQFICHSQANPTLNDAKNISFTCKIKIVQCTADYCFQVHQSK